MEKQHECDIVKHSAHSRKPVRVELAAALHRKLQVHLRSRSRRARRPAHLQLSVVPERGCVWRRGWQLARHRHGRRRNDRGCRDPLPSRHGRDLQGRCAAGARVASLRHICIDPEASARHVKPFGDQSPVCARAARADGHEPCAPRGQRSQAEHAESLPERFRAYRPCGGWPCRLHPSRDRYRH